MVFKDKLKLKVKLTEVEEVIGGLVEEPVSVVVVAEAQRRRRAVPVIDDAEAVRTLGEVVPDDDELIRLQREGKSKRQKERVGPSPPPIDSHLEAVELSIVGDVGDLVGVVEEPVVRLSRRQQGHPAKLMGHPLLQEGNHTGA